MTRPLALPERQVTALCRGAAKAGCVAVVKVNDVEIHLIPTDRAQGARRIDNPQEFETLEQYIAWRDGSAGERSRAFIGSGLSSQAAASRPTITLGTAGPG